MASAAKKLEIKNKLGLHARAAALLVQTVNRFAAEVKISKDGQEVDARSIMGVLTLAATQGSKIHVEAKGNDAEEALRAVEKLVDKKFFEND
ncbi:MAG: phosphocarrier protein HPr [Deltaproteobacteria bacterium RIFCSPLOWO2_12_FULL_60_19]|jgi:phosphocarrier protein|nr:MAG: phosphocarrier protein HPr [Deltaproteobacteria bacterium RIFCSPLOWO2_12_FULL_60_19]